MLNKEVLIMYRLTRCVVLVLASFMFSAQAEDAVSASRLARAEKIAKVLGIDALLASSQESSREAVQHQLDVLFVQMKKTGLPDKYLAELRPDAEKVIVSMVNAWDPKEAGLIYANGLSDSMSDAELNDAAQYFDSAEGRKTYKAISDSIDKTRAFVRAKSEAALENGMAEFLQRVKETAERARAEQAASPKP